MSTKNFDFELSSNKHFSRSTLSDGGCAQYRPIDVCNNRDIILNVFIKNHYNTTKREWS